MRSVRQPHDKSAMGKEIALEVVSFVSAEEVEQWLARNHARSSGICVRFFKKDSGVPSVSHDETLDAALCFGWIDGQLKKHDDESWLQKFTPRRPKSVWSKRNTEHAKRLIRSGRMQPAGYREIEATCWSRSQGLEEDMDRHENLLGKRDRYEVVDGSRARS